MTQRMSLKHAAIAYATWSKAVVSPLRIPVSNMSAVTTYGSMLDAGRRSSRYPFPSRSVNRGMRIDAPRSATPYLKLSMLLVSQSPVSLRSLPAPYSLMCFSCAMPYLSHASVMAFKPPSSRIFFVEKLVWQPAPFQFPGMGFGSNEQTTPFSSHTRCRRKRVMCSWSPALIPTAGPTWYSHWPGITSPLIPLTSRPAAKQ
mmetsp:Transcript_9097/g.18162  ORF Transcript_9097/g.18162 Transcript_9097/m.18162 type:complete len:201 (+) Transcript_9097:3-605(+)